MVIPKLNFTDASAPAVAADQDQGFEQVTRWHIVQVTARQEQRVCDDLRLAGFLPYCPMEVVWRKPRSHESKKRLQALSERRSLALEAAGRIRDPMAQRRALAAIVRSLPRVSSMLGRNPAVEDRRPYLPGYLFLGLLPGQESRLTDVKPIDWRKGGGFDGVIDLVRASGAAVQIHESIVLKLKEREDAGELSGSKKDKDTRKATAFREGQDVRITDGPLARFDAQVERCAPNDRVQILISLFGRPTRAILEASQLEAAS
ncbi:hypothetical protein ABEG18_13120 [Alsobacter sp. KACC 23698]|uniref:NusG-like N-terminal domain-containing protein n=1 Tax=Alsobacter sp. KACC 23698 TaxID=3149229 RepID=A0AAU7J8V0_9HYPH